MEKLIYEIDGKKYLLFSFVCKTRNQAIKMHNKVQNHEGIIQSYEIEESFWNGNKVMVKVLIPEKKATSFGNTQA